jgi:hypothetical protein
MLMKNRFNKRFCPNIVAVLVIGLLSAGPIQAQYSEYKATPDRQLMFTLLFNEDFFGYCVCSGDDTSRFLFNHSAVKTVSQTVTADGATLIDADGLHAAGKTYQFDEVTDIEVSRSGEYTSVKFYTRESDSRQTGRLRRGNLIEPFNHRITVGEQEFVRGTVFTVTGNVEILGEVNKNVISLFGEVYVGSGAVVRGDVVSVRGEIDLASDASVYGAIRSGLDERLGRRHRFRRFHSRYEADFDFDLDSVDGRFCGYNRVDGLSLGFPLRFADPDSVLPTVWAGAGYAFESERWRYDLGFEQTILRHPAFAVGGQAYRLLASEDDWLISNHENTVFALVAGEDYKDFYEAEGARAWLRSHPWGELKLESGFLYEETKWLDARRNLWSIFGGDKLFPENFGSVDSVSRTVGIGVIDSSTNSAFYGQISYDTHDEKEPYYYSGWAVLGELEWSSPHLNSDFDYTRYKLSVTRLQKLNRRITAVVRGVYGGSDGLLPMHKQYYLGGLGTMYGYRLKEYSGSHFWLANLEYRVDFPRSDLAASLMWDLGQISATSNFSDSEVKHSMGVAIYIGSDFKIGLAKRLDRSYDDDPRLFARLTFSI